MYQKKNSFLAIDPLKVSIPEVHKLLLGGIAPRPIALVSTISEDGINNLSPFSFFNAFGANPPTIVFSPANRGRDGSTKDTLENLKIIKECVVQAVTYDIVQQVSLASTEYDSDIDEFIKSGLTPIDSLKIKPKRVAESPFQMECVVKQIIPLGDKNASGNLVICEVVQFHVDEKIMQDGILEPNLIKLVGRNSANYYTKAFDSSIFEIEKPITTKGIGIDQLPDYIKHSDNLSGNELGQLGNIESLPTEDSLNKFIDTYKKIQFDADEIAGLLKHSDYHSLFSAGIALSKDEPATSRRIIEISAKKALEQNDTQFAIKALLSLKLLSTK